jgi:hypothetical protein
LIALALGGLAVTGAPMPAANAQSGDALAQAEHTCLTEGVRPRTEAFDVCVSRTANAFDDGAPDLAYSQAQAVPSARDACLSMGAVPGTLGYRQCLNTEIDRHAERIYAIMAEPVDVPHAIVRIDRYGQRYDRDGNVVDRHGYVIRPNPYSAP